MVTGVKLNVPGINGSKNVIELAYANTDESHRRTPGE